ncbi:LysM peptidoglycan-binding domain-containing protein [Synechococcus sp. WH 8016]|uniref:LysM peptidoglycan-binding domain-containing protein n=1 Tax=Synechococcus sp. WH 8016 TaxID=166318 RepID=UPI00022D9EFC|nr:LysM peptidoglycan-binding domain-containing protein [Synechococcus sp. WH 8016]EHA60242.1 Peptidoglycan-binding lysin domain protein [Synechococcus sp. WH 8016]
MRSIVAAALTLSALMPLQAGAASITVKPGDTISGLADRYGVSVKSLMRENGIRNSNHVEVGQTLRLPSGARGVVSAGKGRHTVRGGDTLGGIAARYRVSEKDLIAINSLPSADHVEVGQTLKLPTSAVLPKPKPVAKAKPTPIKANPNATSHTVARGQTLTQIARAYEVPVASLIDLNTINDPNKVTIGTKLMLRDTRRPETSESVTTSVSTSVSTPVQASTTPAAKPVLTATVSQPAKTVQVNSVQAKSVQAKPVQAKPAATTTAATKKAVKAKPVEAKPAAWRTYGPLQVDWSNWQSMGGSMVAPTLNSEGKPLYVAVNCSAGKINVTSSDGAWKSWIAPQTNFERDLMMDRCKKTA